MPYVQIARIDHWFKNVFMVIGVVLAFFFRPDLVTLEVVPSLLLAVLCTCLVASSNYVLNEFLDGPLDRVHPTKKSRPAAMGLIRGQYAVAEWLALAAIGIASGFTINSSFGFTLVLFWIMGMAYNVPPVRTKELPYLDVLSESLNNPIRLALGWYALIPTLLPPASLTLAYWMFGAFFMAIKRLAEYRHIADPVVAADYRRSFRHYNENRLLVSLMFYVTAGALFLGIFIMRYKLELILSVPAIAGFFAYYMMLGLRPDSPVQNPERLYKQRHFVAYAMLTATIFIALLYSDIPFFYEMFDVDAMKVVPLWGVGR